MQTFANYLLKSRKSRRSKFHFSFHSASKSRRLCLGYKLFVTYYFCLRNCLDMTILLAYFNPVGSIHICPCIVMMHGDKFLYEYTSYKNQRITESQAESWEVYAATTAINADASAIKTKTYPSLPAYHRVSIAPD